MCLVCVPTSISPKGEPKHRNIMFITTRIVTQNRSSLFEIIWETHIEITLILYRQPFFLVNRLLTSNQGTNLVNLVKLLVNEPIFRLQRISLFKIPAAESGCTSSNVDLWSSPLNGKNENNAHTFLISMKGIDGPWQQLLNEFREKIDLQLS